MIDEIFRPSLVASISERNFGLLQKATLIYARDKHPVFMRSRHEGLGIILEELEELKTAIFQKDTDEAVLLELASVAAMCQRMAEDVIYATAKAVSPV